MQVFVCVCVCVCVRGRERGGGGEFFFYFKPPHPQHVMAVVTTNLSSFTLNAMQLCECV